MQRSKAKLIGAIVLGAAVFSLAPTRTCFAQPTVPSTSPATTQAADTRGKLVDLVDIEDRDSLQAHHPITEGLVNLNVSGDVIGGHDLRRMAQVLRTRNSSITYNVRVEPNRPCTVEIEELDGRSHEVRAYAVIVEDVKVAIRTWETCGAGPVHYFVQIPPADRHKVDIKLVNLLDTPCAFARLWVYSDFNEYFANSKLAVPYCIAPTVPLTFHDKAADKAKLDQIRNSLGNNPNVKPAWTTWIAYAQFNDAEVARRIDYAIDLAASENLPVQICFDSWWANTPDGSDGAKGFWTDVQYQQRVYNVTLKRFELSVPNQWSNTPWLSMNNANLSAYKLRKIESAGAHLRDRYRSLCADGKQQAILSVNLDNEPVYWASGNAGLGPDLLQADFSTNTIQAAYRDGQHLDPINGLDKGQKNWLWQNLLHYNEGISKALFNALERDASIVSADSTVIPGDLLRNNVYTQAMMADGALQYPMLDSMFPLWESAAPALARVGGEWNSDSLIDRAQIAHQISLGRNAAVNAESEERAENNRGVIPAFAMGLRYYTPYNYPLDKLNVATQGLKDVTASQPPYLHQPILLQQKFDLEDQWKQKCTSNQGLKVSLLGNTTALAVHPESGRKPAYMTYSIDSPTGRFEGLSVEIQGRARNFDRHDPNVCIRVLAGEQDDPSKMTEAGKVQDSSDLDQIHRIDLTNAVKGMRTAFVRIELSAPSVSDKDQDWCAIYNMRFTLPWPAELLGGGFMQDDSLQTQRNRSLVVSWRRDAELAMDYLDKHLKKPHEEIVRRKDSAKAAYDAGDYARAYRLANEATAMLLPATYLVKHNGQLAPYPIKIDTTKDVTLVLSEWRDDLIRLRAFVAEPTDLAVQMKGLSPDTIYEIEEGNGEWTLRKVGGGGGPGRLEVSPDGEIAFAARLEPVVRRKSYKPVSGVFKAMGAAPGEFLLMPDDGSGTMVMKTTRKTVFLREQPADPAAVAKLQDFRRGDQILAQLDEDGNCQSVDAKFMQFSGKVQAFQQLSPSAMPIITLDADGRPEVLDLAAPIHLPEGDCAMKSKPLGTVNIGPGDAVEVRGNPQTGRIFEVWMKSRATTRPAPTTAATQPAK